MSSEEIVFEGGKLSLKSSLDLSFDFKLYETKLTDLNVSFLYILLISIHAKCQNILELVICINNFDSNCHWSGIQLQL